MTERPIAAPGQDAFGRRDDTPDTAAGAAFIPEPVYARRSTRRRKGVPPALYVAPLVGVALLGGLALMTGSGTSPADAPPAAPEIARSSDASATALAANTLEAPATESAAAEALTATAPAEDAATATPAPRRAVTRPRTAAVPAAAPAAPSAMESGADVAAELPEAPIPYSASAQSSAPAPMINTTPLDIPPPEAAPATSEPAAEPMSF